MIKNKFVPYIGAILAVATFASTSFIANAASPVVPICVGSVSGTTISWSSTTTGGVSPYTYLWTGASLTSTSTNTSRTYSSGTYTAMFTVTDASSTVATTSCSATVASSTPVATTTPPVALPPFFKSPQLIINSGGKFLARGMMVTSVASTSFTGSIYGTTWTINFAPTDGETVQRDGKSVKITTLSAIKVGDEVGVSGMLNTSSPLTVDARVVRDYSLSSSILKFRKGEKDDEGDQGEGNGKSMKSLLKGKNGNGKSKHDN